ncbi:branched-chain amino acid ABC transporter permease [Roseomonas sp. BN140053]|uniref:branched-chain amino acid ABC transporter permease n=1 Tax=Roseomonas sp. BN140053 TaxID=3391898 RepID=UPI0039E7BF6A
MAASVRDARLRIGRPPVGAGCAPEGMGAMPEGMGAVPEGVGATPVLTQQLINGVVLGSMYALIAQGYTLVFGVLDKLNFSHGEIFMLGGFLCLAALALGAPLVVAVLLAILVSGLLGLLVEFVGFRKFRSRDAHVTAALSSFAIGLIMIDLSQKIWGTEPRALDLPAGLQAATIRILGTDVVLLRLGVLAVALLLMLVLHLVVTRSRLGRQIRAVAESADKAALFGIDVTRVNQKVFFIASAMAGLAGAAMALRTGYASTDVGFTFGLKALAIMAIGGMGDLRGALIGGLLVGVVEAVAFNFGLGQLADLLVWLFMIAVLLWRPSGLFGSSLSRETRA